MESQWSHEPSSRRGAADSAATSCSTATIELFAEGGSRMVTHRAVARRAGLPPATTTYYFASIEDLLREALAAHIAAVDRPTSRPSPISTRAA